jgi:hypothetical protein
LKSQIDPKRVMVSAVKAKETRRKCLLFGEISGIFGNAVGVGGMRGGEIVKGCIFVAFLCSGGAGAVELG